MFRILSRSGEPWGNHAAAFCCAHHWLASLVGLSAQSLLWFWCNQYGSCFGIWRTNVPPVTFQQRSFRHPWGLSLTTRNLFAERDRQYFTACRWNEIQESGWCWEMLFAKILSWKSGCMVSRFSPGSTVWGLSNCGGFLARPPLISSRENCSLPSTRSVLLPPILGSICCCLKLWDKKNNGIFTLVKMGLAQFQLLWPLIMIGTANCILCPAQREDKQICSDLVRSAKL